MITLFRVKYGMLPPPSDELTSFLFKQSHIYTCATKNKRNSQTQNEVIIGGFNCENFFNKKTKSYQILNFGSNK